MSLSADSLTDGGKEKSKKNKGKKNKSKKYKKKGKVATTNADASLTADTTDDAGSRTDSEEG